ncbi:VTC domain-containing protein [Chlamydoabsidia padenii]|nr:VTC domain-containing protein [Chlamydoabsidia padenii]
MKYEQKLKARMNPSWRLYYMAYGQLKQLLKQRSNHWRTQDEEEFEAMIGSELSKVCRFLHHQLDHITKQTQLLETQYQQQTNSTVDTTRVTTLIFELNDTCQFLHANRTAFDKMVKKHDRYTNLSFRTSYNRLVGTSSIDTYTQQLDTLMIRLCYLYDLGRQPQHTNVFIDEQRDQNEQCTRFWIHPDNINEVKAICLFHLPMVSTLGPQDYTAAPDTSHHDINTMYLDNNNFDLYRRQTELCNNSNSNILCVSEKDSLDQMDEVIKCRWYGYDNSTMHLERHQCGNRQQCVLKGISLASCLGGGYHLGITTTSPDQESTRQQILESIRQQHLEPKCRSTCQRTIFHQQGSSFRLHVDTNIKLYKVSTNGANVCGNDGNTVSSFPYALLTIHHDGKSLGDTYWLSQLLSSHLVYPVPRFSTFSHGIFLFYSDQLALSFITPWWMSLMTMDIRKQPCNRVGLTRSASSSQPLINGHRPTSFDAHDKNRTQHISIPFSNANTPIIHRSRWRRRRDHQRLDSSSTHSGDPIIDLDTTTIISRGRKKNIDIHSKGNNKLTEPKTYFANERTYLTWLQFCAVLLTVALSLFNHGDKVSRWMGALFLSMTCLMAFYALGRFQYRSWQLRTRRYVIRYDDVYGPTVLCFFLVIAMMINIYLRWPLFGL